MEGPKLTESSLSDADPPHPPAPPPGPVTPLRSRVYGADKGAVKKIFASGRTGGRHRAPPGRPPGTPRQGSVPRRADPSSRRVGKEIVCPRRRASRQRLRRLGRKAEVAENHAHDLSRLDCGDHRHAATASRAGEHVEIEDAPHQIGPGPIARLLGTARPALLGRSLRGRDTTGFRSLPGGVGAGLLRNGRTLLRR